MSYFQAGDRLPFSWLRLALWLINIPVVLFVFWIGLYTLMGGWMSEEAEGVWFLFLLLPLVATIALIASRYRWRNGSRTTANLLLLLPLLSIFAVLAILWALAQ